MPPDPGPVPYNAYRNWPGVDAAGQMHINRAQVRLVAERLQNHLRDLLDADEDLTSHYDASAFGEWDAAQAFAGSYRAGHESLLDQHARFLDATLSVIKRLRRTAQIYDDVEAELARRIAEIEARMRANPTSLGHHSPAPHRPVTVTPGSLDQRQGN